MKTPSGPHRLLPFTILLTAAACLFCTFATTPALARGKDKQEGAALFASSGCTQCHGESGQGTAKGPSLHDVRKRMSADAMKTQIKDGGKAMPPFGESLNHDQIETLVKFLRGRHPKFQAPPTSPH